MSKEFDFEHKDFQKHSKETREFLKKSYRSGMSVEEFVEGYQKTSRPDNRPLHHHRNPSNLRIKYKRLQKEYNFFSPST